MRCTFAAAAAAAALLGPVSFVLSQSTGSLSLITFNVAGLPAVINSNDVPGDKETNAKSIGNKLTAANYDVIHLQEDFNYHAALYSTLNYTNRTPTSGGVPFGSGLNTASHYSWGSTLQRQKWDKCDLNEGDCLTPKGFTYMRLSVPNPKASASKAQPSVTIDLYNLHADAGSDSGDAQARSAGVDQLLSFISAHSGADQPIIIAGDTNDRYTNSASSIARLADSAGLRDAWIELVRKGVRPVQGADALVCAQNPSSTNDCEVVDKVLYRSGAGLVLTPTAFDYVGDEFLQADGNILSDHDPVLVTFKLS